MLYNGKKTTLKSNVTKKISKLNTLINIILYQKNYPQDRIYYFIILFILLEIKNNNIQIMILSKIAVI